MKEPGTDSDSDCPIDPRLLLFSLSRYGALFVVRPSWFPNVKHLPFPSPFSDEHNQSIRIQYTASGRVDDAVWRDGTYVTTCEGDSVPMLARDPSAIKERNAAIYNAAYQAPYRVIVRRIFGFTDSLSV